MSCINVIMSLTKGTGQASGGSGSLDLNNSRIIADGNSYVQGNGYTPFPSKIIASAPFNSNGSTMQNFGVGGQTTPQMLTDQSSQVLSQYNPAYPNILLVCEGGNDIYFFGDVTDAVNNMKDYCNNARSAGFRVILTTCIRRDQTTAFGDLPADYNIKLQQFNDAIVADSSFYDALIRPDLDPVFATYISGGYDADKVHPNNTGQTKFAELFINAMTSLPA